MSSEYYLDLQTSIFSKLYTKTTINDNTKNMTKKMTGDKRNIRSLLVQAVGKSNIKRKPSPLQKFETGYGKWLFGENGVLTQMIPGLRQYYQNKRSKNSAIKTIKIDAGDLTYLYANNSLGSNKTKVLSSRVGRMRQSAFFAVDTSNGIDFFNSHTPVINRVHRSPPKSEQKKKKTQFKTLLIPLFKTNPNLNLHHNTNPHLTNDPYVYCQLSDRINTKTSKPSIYNSTVLSHSVKKNRRSKSMAPKELMNQLNELNVKQCKAEKCLFQIINQAQTSRLCHQKEKINDEELKDIEVIYDIERKEREIEDEAPKTKALMTEVKRTQKELTTNQIKMMKLSRIIGDMNEQSVVTWGNVISQQYEKQKGINRITDTHTHTHSNANSLLQNLPFLLFDSKDKIGKRKKLLLNSEKMKKMTYNVLRSKKKAIDMLDNYNH